MDTVLVERQLLDPVNPVLAHDIGLFHYWRAKKENNPDKAAAHWEGVIGNWAMVLESETYWKDWCAERQEVYEKIITDEHITHAKQALNERIVLDLTKKGQTGSSGDDLHLEGAFFLEIKATRLLKHTRGIRLPSKNNQRLDCGPLLARQLGILPQIKHLLPLSGETLHNKRHSVDIILAPLKKGSDGSAANDNNLDRQLRLCFSQLGIPFVYLERGESQRTLKILTALRCPDCEPDTNKEEKEQISTNQLPSRCRDDCANFAQWNPVYDFGRAGRDVFYRHAIELNAGARLCLAQQIITEEPVDMAALLEHIQGALNISQSIGIGEALQAEVADTMLGWADGLVQSERWDDAITLLENTGNFEKGELWKGKLAGLLNRRGVKNADEERWKQSVVDLRRAYELNPHLSVVPKNFAQALYTYAEYSQQDGNESLALNLVREGIRLCKNELAANPDDTYWKIELKCFQDSLQEWGGESDTEAAGIDEWDLLSQVVRNREKQEKKTVSPVPHPSEVLSIDSLPKSRPLKRLVMNENELGNPFLFDKQGRLKWEVFSNSGQAILDLVQREAVAMKQALINLPILFLSLTQLEGGETNRLLKLQGISHQQLQTNIRDHTPPNSHSIKVKSSSALTQFNIENKVLDALDLAWEIATKYDDRGVIDESHILFCLLLKCREMNMNIKSNEKKNALFLKNAGLDVDLMIQQVGY